MAKRIRCERKEVTADYVFLLGLEGLGCERHERKALGINIFADESGC